MIRPPTELLTNEQMAEADRLAVEMGVPSLTLMENAGRAVADEAVKMVDAGARIVVLCGPGNNGGDGFVAARLLNERGYDVAVYLLGDVGALKGDAAANARRWRETGSVRQLEEAAQSLAGCEIVIDALFGAGLARPIEGTAATVIENVNANAAIPVLAVDVPSGLNGNTGQPRGDAVVKAERTVTFYRRKPGHLLEPGRSLCGKVVLADIGTPAAVLPADTDEDAGRLLPGQAIIRANAAPRYTLPRMECAAEDRHKYSFGHAVIFSGPAHCSGAARLTARAALRIGAGLVTVAADGEALGAHAAQLNAIMLAEVADTSAVARLLSDRRLNSVAIGPGHGGGQKSRSFVEAILASDADVVLDADALTAFEGNGEILFKAIAQRRDAGREEPAVVLTPHEGEFARLFPDLSGDKLSRAQAAAARSGAVVVLKGRDTVIAASDGRTSINENAPIWLATAGSGDVLCGLIAGLMAQGVPAYRAACAGVYMHGDAASRFGPGLIAEDLPEMIPHVLSDLQAAGF